MMCKDCSHFRILYEPLLSGKECWDFGKAKCEKHDLYVRFRSAIKLNKLICIDEVKKEDKHET